jgi:hypothetical protein
MKLLRVILAAVFALASFSAFAQDAAGKWDASIETPNGAFNMTFEFAVDGGNLTGSVTNAFGATPISEGKISGNDLTFTLSFPGMDGNPMTIDYQATVNGDEMAITSKFRNPPAGSPAPPEQTFKATRAQ